MYREYSSFERIITLRYILRTSKLVQILVFYKRKKYFVVLLLGWHFNSTQTRLVSK